MLCSVTCLSVRVVLPIVMASVLCCASAKAQQTPATPPVQRADGESESAAGAAAVKSEAARFEEFSKSLRGVAFVGQFTIDGQDTPPRKERYEIKEVTKSPRGDYWVFQARITYGEHDVSLPLPLVVKWAGNTPVITLDNVAIPGLGTFDARVVVDGKRYAGTWQHGEVGGHLFGNIEPLQPESP